VLANEQVHNGRCWRCDAPVAKRDLEQWFFRITKYADDLLDFSEADWPERIKSMQTNWIGRSEGVEFDLPVDEHADLKISVFTTRVDTVFSSLNQCNTNDEMQKIDTEMSPKLSAHEDTIALNPALFILLLMGYEIAVGVLLLSKQRAVKVGLIGGILFLIGITPLSVETLANPVMAVALAYLFTKEFDRSFLDIVRAKLRPSVRRVGGPRGGTPPSAI